MFLEAETWIALLQIIGVNIILSGDNAVVIALACRSLPPRQQRLGVVLGAGIAVLLRIVFTGFVAYLMTTPFLKIVGGILLLWIGYKLLTEEESDENDVHAASHLLGAVRTVVIADAVMSLDNVIAVAAAAKDNYVLLILGLAISIPLVVYGATLMIKLIARFPFIVTLGAALIGYIGGEVIVTDPGFQPWVDGHAHWLHLAAPILGAVIVLDLGRLLGNRPIPGVRNAAEGAAASTALFGLRFLFDWVGRMVLARAPLIVVFIAGLLGYGGSELALQDSAGAVSSDSMRLMLDTVAPIVGVAVALIVAEGIARLCSRASGA
jgi:YjbE family integral membrane protein